MKRTPGLSDLMRRYASGGMVADTFNPAKRLAQVNPGATFTGSPAGTGLTAGAGAFTKASGEAIKPAAPAASEFPGSFDQARMNSLSAFLGGPLTDTTSGTAAGATEGGPRTGISGQEAAPAVPATTPGLPVPGGIQPSAPVARASLPPASNLSLPPPAPVQPSLPPMSAEELDAMMKTTKFGLPTGETVGYGGKLNDDVRRAYRAELGREAEQGGLDYWRNRLANGATPEQIMAEINASPEGKEFNLTVDPLDDDQFVTRAFRTVLGRDPDEGGRAWLTNMLRQGFDRQKALDLLLGSDEFKSRKLTKDEIGLSKLIEQGDAFKPELKNDETEKIVAQQFKAALGRDPTDYELAKYASSVRSGAFSLNPGANSIVELLAARKAGGWARGGRVRKWIGGPGDEPAMKRGGRVKYARGGRTGLASLMD